MSGGVFMPRIPLPLPLPHSKDHNNYKKDTPGRGSFCEA